MKFDIADSKLTNLGTKRILWADADMPVLAEVRRRFVKEKPLRGQRMSCCLHVTAETANLARTLKAGGADVKLCASNPLSTQDDVAASLSKKFGIPTFAIKGENINSFYKHLNAVVDHKPTVTMDDGADLVNLLHTKRKDEAKNIVASLEETTTGVIRLRAMEKQGSLKFPVIAVNDADTKHLFDNRYGTGQSTMDGVIRATDFLIAGKRVVVIGYGYCGRGVASRADGMGARVIVVEVNPVRALEAVMSGYDVMPISQAARIGDLFISVTGNKHVIRQEHFKNMKDGAIVCNSGHFDVELDIPGLKKASKKLTKDVRNFVDEYRLRNGNRVYLLAEGRLVNLSAAEGHPASVMDMSFSTQALASEYALKNHKKLDVRVHDVPKSIDKWVATLKLKTMGISIEKLTADQRAYLASSGEGT